MAESDWTLMSDALDTASVKRGVTSGLVKPASAISNSFVYGFNSVAAVTGCVARFANQVNFAPMAEGGSIRAAMKRLPSGGPTGFSPFIFLGAQGLSVNDSGYLLGLSDGDPSRIVLKKGTIATGVPDAAPDPTNNGILLRSTGEVEEDEWRHLRLDMIVNTNGDVLLQVFENDLSAQGIGDPPSWVEIPGMEGPLSDDAAPIDGFIDDALSIATGSAPYTSGRGGFGFACSDVTRRVAFDHIEVIRQT